MADLFFTEDELREIDIQVRNEVSTLEDRRILRIKSITQEKNKLRDEFILFTQ